MEAPELVDKEQRDVTGAGLSSTCLFLVLFWVRDRAFVSMNHWSGLWLSLNTGKTARCHQHPAGLEPYLNWLHPVVPHRIFKPPFYLPLMVTLSTQEDEKSHYWAL